MNDSSASFPFWLPFLFIGMWLFMTALFSFISGWHSLAYRFRATFQPEGQKVSGQVKQMGTIPENRVTHMIISQAGLYLYASLLFRFLHPALLIPWEKVRSVKEIKMLWWRTYELDIASITKLRITIRAYEVMQKYLSQ